MSNNTQSTLGDYFSSSRVKGREGLPLLSVTLNDGLIDRNDLERRTETNLLPEDHLLVRKGDIAFNMMRMWQGAFGLSQKDGLVSPAYIVLNPKKNTDSLYASYLFKTQRMIYLFWAYSYGITNDRLRLYFNDFEKIPAHFPEIKKQTKIAKILSTWDKAIATTERLLANSQQQKQALMQQLLTGQKRFAGFSESWLQVTLDEIFEKICNGVTYDANATTGLPVSRIETISTGKINFSKVGWAPDNESTRRFQLKNGDILYSHINSLEHIGRVALFNSESPLFHGMNLLLLRPNKRAVPEFIFHILNSKVGKKYARNYAKSAVNQASISTTDVKSFVVDIPTLPEQQKIAQVLSTADVEISNLQAQLAKLKLEKKALMQQLLTGQRRVKLDADAAA